MHIVVAMQNISCWMSLSHLLSYIQLKTSNTLHTLLNFWVILPYLTWVRGVYRQPTVTTYLPSGNETGEIRADVRWNIQPQRNMALPINFSAFKVTSSINTIHQYIYRPTGYPSKSKPKCTHRTVTFKSSTKTDDCSSLCLRSSRHVPTNQWRRSIRRFEGNHTHFYFTGTPQSVAER